MYISNSIKMDRLQKLGRDLGYEGKDLQDFVAQKISVKGMSAPRKGR